MTSIEKAIALLALISERPTPARFSDLERQSGYAKSTLHRLLGELSSEELIALDADSQTYHPGLRLMEFAHQAWRSLDLNKVATPQMERLAEATGETVHLAILDDTDVVYIDKRESDKMLRLYSAVGKRGPAYCTGVGKALLAFSTDDERDRLLDRISLARNTESTITERDMLIRDLADIRRQGYALDREEHEEGVCCIAVPIIKTDSQIAGALSLTVPTARMPLDKLRGLHPEVIDAAAKIAHQLNLLH